MHNAHRIEMLEIQCVRIGTSRMLNSLACEKNKPEEKRRYRRPIFGRFGYDIGNSTQRWRMKLKVLISMLVLGIASAKADDKFTCPITKSAPVIFVPTGTFANHQASLLGTEKLFTVFPGNWQTTQKTERGYRVPKIVWGTVTFDLKQEVTGSSLTITGRRLDAEPSGPLQFGGASTAWIDEVSRFEPVPKEQLTPIAKIDKDQFFITSEFYVPTLGCWEVTGHFHGTDLTIVVDLK